MSPVCKIFYLLALFMMYMAIFGGIMYAVEKTENDQKRHEKHVILQNLWMNIQGKYNMTREEFDNMTRVIHQSQVMDGEPWTFAKGVRFAIVVCTTIGYGNITPKTKGGMMVCVLGAIFGIPLTLMTLNAIGAVVKDGGTKIIHTFETRLLKRTSVQSMEMKRLVFISFIMILMILFGAAVVTQVSEWSFTESVYFWFVSFSTIGFGDYVADDSTIETTGAVPAVAIANIIFILIGLAILACGINCVLDISLTSFFCCSQLTRASQVENTEMDCPQKDKEKTSA